jgi:predicted XRE-type DNA-binding protein
MKHAKRRRLEAAGWKLGDTKEFLRLSDAEATLIEIKLQLADALRDMRSRHRLTQEQASKVLRSSQSRVAKMESGDPTVSLDLLVRSLLKLGASRGEIARHVGRRRGRRAA